MNSTTTPQLTPEMFKDGTMKAHPEWVNAVASDGTKYTEMDPADFTRRFATRYPNALTSTGHKYADYLPPAPPEPIVNNGSDDTLSGKLSNRVSDIINVRKQFHSGQLNPVSGITQIAGDLGGGINDIAGAGLGLINKGLRYIPGVAPAEDAVMGAAKSGIQSAASSPIGQKIIQKGEELAQAHPEAAKNIGAVGNVIGAATLFTGGGAAKEGISSALGKDALTSVAEEIAPSLSGKAGLRVLAKGGIEKQGLFRKIVPAISDSLKEDAQTVLDNVPNYLKLSTYGDKLNAVKDAIGTMAENLKSDVIQSGKDKIFPFRELASHLRSLPVPDSMTRDLEPVYERVIKKAIQISKESGGKISDLFDARKAFDNYVSETFPTLYTNLAETPTKVTIKNIRNGMNDFIARNLPDVPDFRKRLLDQSTLFSAAENLAPRAMKEIGTGGVERFIGNHPAIKNSLEIAKKYALPAASAGGGYGLFQKIFGQR